MTLIPLLTTEEDILIQANWEEFSAKFSTNKEKSFEWFAYLLFCREHNLPNGWSGYANQSAIEKHPLHHNGKAIGFQAKFYGSNLSQHKQDFLTMLDNARRDYPELTRILIYTNQEWTQHFNRTHHCMLPTQAQVDIEHKATELGITLEWRDKSFFESEFVCSKHIDLAKYFFTSNQFKGWQRFGDWSSSPSDTNAEYLIDDNLKIVTPNSHSAQEMSILEGIQHIRQLLNPQTDNHRSVRLIGLSGVGKTRFAQALFDERLGENCLDLQTVWYCDLGDSPLPTPEHFIDEIIQTQNTAIFIIDNCGKDTHARLTQKIKNSNASLNSNVSLLTIEYDIEDGMPESTDVFKLNPTSTEILAKIIEKKHPNINQLNSQKIAAAANGNYRLGLAIASNIQQTENLALLTDTQLFERLFYQAEHRNDDLYKIAQSFALVYSFNIEDSEQDASEIDYLAKIAKIDTDHAIDAIETLKQKDIVQQRGPWRAILPHALANHLAQKFIQTKLRNQLNKIIISMPERLQRSCIKRLSYFHHLPEAQTLVKDWTQPQGWLGDKLLNHILSKQELDYLRLLTPLAATEILTLLQEKFQQNKSFFSRKNNTQFIAYSHLLHRLAYEEAHFKPAVELLVSFSKDENPDENNNSIHDLIASLFHMYFSQSLATLQTKQTVLRHLLSQPNNQQLLSIIVKKALDFNHGGIRYHNEEDGVTEVYGYQPETWDELWRWVDFLLSILNELDIHNLPHAREIFSFSLKDIIWTCGKTDIAAKYLQLFHQRKFFTEAYYRLNDIIKFNQEQLTNEAPKILIEIQQLCTSLSPTQTDLGGLIATYIAISEHDYYRFKHTLKDKIGREIKFFDTYENLFSHIEAKLHNFEAVHPHFEALVNTPERSFDFQIQKLGLICAASFENKDQVIDLFEQTPLPAKPYAPSFLIGITLYFKQCSQESYQSLLRYYANTEKFQYIFHYLAIATCQSDEDALFYLALLPTQNHNLHYLPRMAFFKHQHSMAASQFEIIVDGLIEMNEEKTVIAQLLDHCYIEESLPKKYQDFLIGNFNLLMQMYAKNNHDLEVMLSILLKSGSETQAQIFKQMQIYLQSQDFLFFSEYDIEYMILTNLIQCSTEQFLITFFDQPEFTGKYFRDSWSQILAEADTNIVLKWIDHDQSKISLWAQCAHLFDTQKEEIIWTDLLIDLLKRSELQNATLQQILKTNIFTIGAWSGSRSQEMKTRLPRIDALSAKIEPHFPHLLAEIEEQKQSWLKDIQYYEAQELKEFKLRNERFDY